MASNPVLTRIASGAKASEIRYCEASLRDKPWGETRYSSGTTATNYRYTGQREESSFGLYFYNARWLDVQLGRFVQADSIVPGGVQGLDRYAYVNNSPLVYVDPSGHKCAEGIYAHEECEGPLEKRNLLIFETEGKMQWTEDEMAGFNKYAMDVAQSYANAANTILHTQCMAAENPNNEPCNSISPTDAFYKIHNDEPVTVIRKSQTCDEAIGDIYPDCGGWGYAASPNEIWIFSNATSNDIATHPQLIVHELGHAFAQVGVARGFDWVYTGLSINRNGFYGPALSWQLSTDMSPSEIYADMFLGWVYGKWEPGQLGKYSLAGQSKAEFMYGTNTYILKLLGLYP